VAYLPLLAVDVHDSNLVVMIELFAIAVVIGVAYAWFGRTKPIRAVRYSVLPDAIIIAAIIAATGVPEEITIGYLWPVAVASFFLSFRVAVASWVFAVATAAAVLYFSDTEVSSTALVSNLLGLFALGALLIFIGFRLRKHEMRLRMEQVADHATLGLISTLHAGASVNDVAFRAFVRSLALGTGGDRCRLRIFTDGSDDRVVEWHSPEVGPLDIALSEEAADRLGRNEIMSLRSRDEITDEQERERLAAMDIGSGIGMPITWDGVMVGVLSLHSRSPRDWIAHSGDLLNRLAPVLGTILVHRGVVENQQRSLATLRDLSALRERLVATTSHELRTPLTIINGYLETVARDDIDVSDDVAQMLRKGAVDATRRLVRITDDLLELHRLSHERPHLSLDRVDIGELMELCLGPFDTDKVSITVTGDDLKLTGDSDRLQQAIGNLVANGLRHGGGCVSVSIASVGGQIEFEICDDGAGVPAEHHAQLFQPFASFSQLPDSTGLGLAVTRAVVEAHRGTIRYRAADGTRPHAFVVRLPQARSVATASV
jgi:signal transduction histidine kinase